MANDNSTVLDNLKTLRDTYIATGAPQKLKLGDMELTFSSLKQLDDAITRIENRVNRAGGALRNYIA